MQLSSRKIFKFILSLYLLEEMILANLSWNFPFDTFARSASNIVYYLLLILIIFYSFFGFYLNRFIFSIFALLSLVITYISGKTTGDIVLTLVFPIIFLAFNQELYASLRFYFKNLVLFFILIILFCEFGLTENLVVNFNYGTAYSLGTGHPNNLAAYLVNILLLYMFLYLKKKNVFINVIIALIGAVIIWKLTVSRTAVIEIMLYIILFVFYRILQTVKISWLVRLIEIAGVGMIILSVYYMLNYSNITASTDSSFLVRFSQGNLIYSMYGIHFWGNKIPFVSTFEATRLHIPALILDNGYLRMLVYHGIACSIIFFSLIIFMFKNLNKNKKYYLLIIAVVFMVGGFMEKSVYLIQYNFTLIIIFMKMSSQKNEEEII